MDESHAGFLVFARNDGRAVGSRVPWDTAGVIATGLGASQKLQRKKFVRFYGRSAAKQFGDAGKFCAVRLSTNSKPGLERCVLALAWHINASWSGYFLRPRSVLSPAR